MTVGTGDGGTGGAMTLTAGDTSAANAAGGSLDITAGSSTTSGAGGAVSISGGVGASGLGGAVTVSSGVGTDTSSGAVLMESSNAGNNGVSGNMVLKTGTGFRRTVGVVHGDDGRGYERCGRGYRNGGWHRRHRHRRRDDAYGW